MTQKELERKARFIIVVKELNLDRQRLADRIGYKKRYLDQVLSADKNFSDAMFFKFTKWYKVVNEKWLDTGIGEMLNTNTSDDDSVLNDPESAYKRNPAVRDDPFSQLREMMMDQAERIISLEEEVERMRVLIEELRR